MSELIESLTVSSMCYAKGKSGKKTHRKSRVIRGKYHVTQYMSVSFKTVNKHILRVITRTYYLLLYDTLIVRVLSGIVGPIDSPVLSGIVGHIDSPGSIWHCRTH